MTEMRSCPACFTVKRIPVPMPVCQHCVKLVPNKMQSDFVTAINTGDKKAELRLAAEIVTTAWDAAEERRAIIEEGMSAAERRQRFAFRRQSRGAR
ncbi:MAG TPA: hypothetical protein VKA60_27610 [Blastocatellia bacterium]|nr:hypothetical protein [Blastocatellia bacterium]